MAELLENRWIRQAGVVAVAVLVGIAISAVIFSRDPQDPTLGPVKLTTGGTLYRMGPPNPGPMPRTRPREVLDEVLPLTGAEAVAAGWKDPLLCSQDRGKYYEKVADEGIPYTLMYNSADELIGIYQFSKTEMPAPWKLTEEISGGAAPVIDYEHWGLFIYFRDPTRACQTGGPKEEVGSAFR